MHDDRVERFRALYDEAYPRMMGYVMRRVRVGDDTHDVVSEIFTTAWRRFDDIPTGEARMPWMYGVARRALANHYRSHTRRHRLADRLAQVPAGGGDSSDAVQEALDALRPDDREILTLVAWDDLDNDEIAAALGVAPGTVAVRLHRARKRMAAELGRRGVRSPNEVKSKDIIRTPGEVNGTPEEVRRT
ncbi:MAG: RNA polymerase sigma factor [Actinomycetota bacterium]